MWSTSSNQSHPTSSSLVEIYVSFYLVQNGHFAKTQFHSALKGQHNSITSGTVSKTKTSKKLQNYQHYKYCRRKPKGNYMWNQAIHVR